MPNLRNAKKALRQAKKRAELNTAYKLKYRDAVKKTNKAPTKEEALKLAKVAQQALDKAAKHGTIKKNTAARRLSRLMKKINKLEKK